MRATLATGATLAVLLVASACPAAGAARPARVLASPAARATPDPDSGAELIGTPAPVWTFDRFLRTKPLSVRALRGNVVLVRWWTEGCHFCRTTLPVIERLRVREGGKGLVVLGVFHPKPPRPVKDRQILDLATELGFGGPIAVDGSWKTLDRYWLAADPERNWTSVSFLIDRHGVIRWVHGGGEYHPNDDPQHARCDAQYRELERVLADVLAEAPGPANVR